MADTPSFGQKLAAMIEDYCIAREDYVDAARDRRDNPNEETTEELNRTYDSVLYAKKMLADSVDAMFSRC